MKSASTFQLSRPSPYLAMITRRENVQMDLGQNKTSKLGMLIQKHVGYLSFHHACGCLSPLIFRPNPKHPATLHCPVASKKVAVKKFSVSPSGGMTGGKMEGSHFQSVNTWPILHRANRNIGKTCLYWWVLKKVRGQARKFANLTRRMYDLWQTTTILLLNSWDFTIWTIYIERKLNNDALVTSWNHLPRHIEGG